MEINLNTSNEEETIIVPSEAIIVAKGRGLISQFEIFNKGDIPKVEWILEVVDAGKECRALFDTDGNLLKGIVVLENGNIFKHVATNSTKSYSAQSKFAKLKGMSYNKQSTITSPILIEETFLIPYYNYMGIIKDGKVKLEGVTVYDLHKVTNLDIN